MGASRKPRFWREMGHIKQLWVDNVLPTFRSAVDFTDSGQLRLEHQAINLFTNNYCSAEPFFAEEIKEAEPTVRSSLTQ